MTSAAAILERVQDLVNKFNIDNDAQTTNEISENLLNEVEALKGCSLVKEEKLLATIHSIGITLWNLVIAKKTGKKISSAVCTRARYVSLQLTFMANFQDNSQNTSRKQLAMAVKTGREWLDCNNHSLADTCFVLATECYMKLTKLIGDEENSSQIHVTEEQLAECHQNMIRVYGFRAEVALHQSQHATALEYLAKAKELLVKYRQLGDFVCGICYNFGLDLYQKELYSYSAEWLRESLNIGKDEADVKDERQAITGQLLAIVYMELKEECSYRKALEVIESSILMQPHIKSVFLKLKILLQLDEEDAVILRAFNDMVVHPSINMDLALECVGLFSVGQRTSLCHESLTILNKKYPRLQDNVRVQLTKLEILLAEKQEDEANELMKTELLRANNHGVEFDKNSLRKLQLLLWEQAQIAYEKKDFVSALHWYNYSSEFMKQSNDQHEILSKLQRNRSSCLIELQNFDEATNAIVEAEKEDPNSPHVYFLLFKIALLTKDDGKALNAVERLTQISLELPESETVHGLVCLAAQLAFENGNRTVSESLLEKMVGHSKNRAQSLVTIRCLTRLKFTNLANNNNKEDLEKVLDLVQKAYEILVDFKSTSGSLKEKESSEVSWFNKIAWNMALSCTEHYSEMQKSFLLCYHLSLLLPQGAANISQQRSSLLMAIGCGLQVARDIIYDNEKSEKLQEVLQLVEKCKGLTEQMQQENPDVADSSLVYLTTYEFEAKVRLGCIDVEPLLADTHHLPGRHAKIFENYANIALSIRGDAKEIGVKALKSAIKCHLEEENVDYQALSMDIHSLISVSLQKGGNTNEVAKEDAYNYYQDAMKIIDTLVEGEYPEMEIVWMMTKAWNCGIHFYSGQHYGAAEKWCLLSMKFLKYLKDMKNNYEDHMVGTYADIMSRIQHEKVETAVK